MEEAPNAEVVRRFTVGTPGFVLREDVPNASRESRRHSDDLGRPLPRLVPGPRSDASVGVAIAHFKAPLQDVVRAARDAERRAKRDATKGGLGRAAVAVTLMKRSGEIVEWGARAGRGSLRFIRAFVLPSRNAVLAGNSVIAGLSCWKPTKWNVPG